MNLTKKLAAWERAGLIDADTRARIEAHEAGQGRPLVLYAMLGLGALTVGLGIVSVVAANWAGLSDTTKLAADVLIACALGAATFVSARRDMPLATDVLVLVYYVFTLASIALLGQVYQLGAPTYQALCTWSLVTAPLVWLGHSRWLGLIWCAGLTWTYALGAEALLDTLDSRGLEDNLAVVMVGAWLLGGYAAVRAWASPRRPKLAAGVSAGLRALMLFALMLTTVPWYERISDREVLGLGVVVLGAMVLVARQSLPWLLPDASTRERGGVAALLLGGWLSLALSTTFARDDLEAVGGLSQLALLCLLAWTAAQGGRLRAFNLLTGLIALRVLVIYFEVFGSMLDTGVGMITGGALTLLMAWVWRKRSPELARQLAGGAS